MIYFLTALLAIGAFLLVGYGLFLVVQYRTNSEVRASREKSKEIAKLKRTLIGYKTRQALAVDSLNKISADYTHNPALEARVCLDNITAHEIKELERDY